MKGKIMAKSVVKKVQYVDLTVSKQDSDKILENPLRMCDSNREEEDCL
jgi:hypothetical protein